MFKSKHTVMGAENSSTTKPLSSRKSSATESMDLSLAPIELLSHILSFVDPKTQVFSCRHVCSTWRDVVETESLRKRAIMLNTVKKSAPKLPWYVYYACGMGKFKTNLLANPYGKDGIEGWNPVNKHTFIVENPVVGVSPIPDEALVDFEVGEMEEVGCFATSNTLSAKEQVIKLKDHSFTSKIMDEIKPKIEISEWYASRHDCSSIYKLTAELLDESMNPIQSDTFDTSLEALTEWSQAKIVFQDYPPGGRFIRFLHAGKDTQYWDGHYGSKMTLGSVRLYLPDTAKLQ